MPISHHEPGVFTISLDFELHWGARDHRSAKSSEEQVLGGRAAVPKLLELFKRYGIHATWATVGFMFFESQEELLQGLPAQRPAYTNAKLNPYAALSELGKNESDDPLHYAPSLIQLISQAPGQEIATHTFSHYYCLEPGQTTEDFRADLAAACALARRKVGSRVESIVFPRNQFNERYIALCEDEGIRTYRGNPPSWVYEPRARSEDNLVHRAVRLADSYINLTGHHGHARGFSGTPGQAVNVPASRFLRSSSKRLASLESLRLKRILADLSHCAERGLLYHLWWHPENFGQRQAENLEFLENILRHFSALRGSHGMRSLGMSEAGNWMRGNG